MNVLCTYVLCWCHSSMLFLISDTHEFNVNSHATAVSLPPIDNLNPRPVQLPMAIPRDLADRYCSMYNFRCKDFRSRFIPFLLIAMPLRILLEVYPWKIRILSRHVSLIEHETSDLFFGCSNHQKKVL